MALPPHLPFWLSFGWTMRANISKQALTMAQTSESLGLGQANRRELSSAGKALASLLPSLHFSE